MSVVQNLAAEFQEQLPAVLSLTAELPCNSLTIVLLFDTMGQDASAGLPVEEPQLHTTALLPAWPAFMHSFIQSFKNHAR